MSGMKWWRYAMPVVVAAFGVGYAPAALSAEPDYGYIAKGTICVPSGTAEQPRVAAKTKWLMEMKLNPAETIGEHFKLQAKLVRHGAGLSWYKGYRETKAAMPLPNHHTGKTNLILWVTTDWASGQQDWDLAVKLIWERPAPHADIVKKLRVPFNECAPAEDGGLLPAPPTPITN
jgi:hypothetical protein